MFPQKAPKIVGGNAFWRILPANFTLSLCIECNSDNNFVPYGKYDLPRSDRKLSPVFVRVLDGFLSPRDENSNGSQIERNKFEPNHKKYNATVEPSLVEPSLRGCFFWSLEIGSRLKKNSFSNAKLLSQSK